MPHKGKSADYPSTREHPNPARPAAPPVRRAPVGPGAGPGVRRGPVTPTPGTPVRRGPVQKPGTMMDGMTYGTLMPIKPAQMPMPGMPPKRMPAMPATPRRKK